jgi:putative salt-induced outer membrane protein YdiY
MSVKLTIPIIFLVFLLTANVAHADYFFLKNGDRVSGDVIKNNDKNYRIKTYYFGELTLDKTMIRRIQTNIEHDQEIKKTPAGVNATNPLTPVSVSSPRYWDKRFSAGYQVSNGNTRNSHLNVGVDSHYKKDRNEWTIKSIFEYGSDNDKMDTQKYFAKVQNDSRLARNQKWFYSRTIEFNHDRFANIDYRVLPSVGMGYWFREGNDSKSEADLGLGWEYTNFRDDTKPSGNTTLIPHFYYDKTLIGKLKISEDVTFYPSVSNINDYRFRSETSLITSLNVKLSWKVSFVDEFNNDPGSNFKKNDTTFRSSLEYSF